MSKILIKENNKMNTGPVGVEQFILHSYGVPATFIDHFLLTLNTCGVMLFSYLQLFLKKQRRCHH